MPSNEERLWYCSQTAQGFAYLSGIHIVHRDIAARNILLLDPNASSYGFPIPKVCTCNSAAFVANHGGTGIVLSPSMLVIPRLVC